MQTDPRLRSALRSINSSPRLSGSLLDIPFEMRVPRKNRWSRFATLLAGLCLLLVGALIFREFLFGGKVLLYTDIGTDSMVVFYAEFVHLSNYIRSQGFPSWSFYTGMGQDLACATGYLVWQPVSWLPRNLIAPALVFQHL